MEVPLPWWFGRQRSLTHDNAVKGSQTGGYQRHRDISSGLLSVIIAVAVLQTASEHNWRRREENLFAF